MNARFMHLLFVCSQNRRRSLTAETMFDGVNGHRVRSAGTEKNARVKVTAGLIGWADVIFCFEKKHLRRMQERYGQELCGKKVIMMNVPDEYEYMDEELQKILRGFAEEYLG